jgi:hypothetical protein
MRGTSSFFAVVAFLALVVSGGGCEAIIPNDVPAYTCTGTSLSACPEGYFCAVAGCAPCQKYDTCNHLDDNCDGVVDDGPFADHDMDGYPVCGKLDPTTGHVTDIDCNDDDPSVHPNGDEICNGIDDNCDGIIDNPDLVCPPGETCLPQMMTCVGTAQTCVMTGCTPPQICDTTTQQCEDPPTVNPGGTCATNSQCNSSVCGTTTILGSVAPAGGACTEPCCVSSDCPAGLVCYAAGTGGNYCVAPSTLPGRAATVGAGSGGASCGSNTDCRSGLCQSLKCADSCCSNASCSNGTICGLGTDGTFGCLPPQGTKSGSDNCNEDSDCQDSVCLDYTVTGRCAVPCCGSPACPPVDLGYAGSFTTICYELNSDYEPALGNNVAPVCAYVTDNVGNGGVGASCSSNSDCRSDICLSGAGQCTDVCCTDADCAAGGANWKCQPTTVGSGQNLRCVPVTSTTGN